MCCRLSAFLLLAFAIHIAEVAHAAELLPMPKALTARFGEVFADDEKIRIQSVRSTQSPDKTFQSVRALFNDREFRKAMGIGSDFIFDDETAEEFLLYGTYVPQQPENLISAVIIDKDSGQMAGIFSVLFAMDSTEERRELRDDSIPVKASVGYGLLPEFRSKGLASRAVRLAIDKMRAQNRRINIIANVVDWNKASKAVLRRNGFSFHAWSDQEFNGIPLCVYALSPQTGFDF